MDIDASKMRASDIFVLRSLFNGARDPDIRQPEDWPVLNGLRYILRARSSRPVEFFGVRDTVPDVITIRTPNSPGPITCVYSERHYCIMAQIKTLAVTKFSDRRQKLKAAHNLFLRLGADYLLQQGAHHDAARFFCASWLNYAGDDALAVDSGLFEAFASETSLTSSLADGGWPLAHELGHALSDQESGYESILSRLLDGQLSEYPDRPVSDSQYSQLLAELMADCIGSEYLLRAFLGKPVHIYGLLGEFIANIWVMQLMEGCKANLAAVSEQPGNALQILTLDNLKIQTWFYDIRLRLLLHGLKVDIESSFSIPAGQAPLDDIIRIVSKFTFERYATLLLGFRESMRNAVEWPLLQEIDHSSIASQNRSLRVIVQTAISRSPFVGASIREFVTRARGTNNFRNQDTSLIDFLDHLAPKEVMRVNRPKVPVNDLEGIDELSLE